MRVVFVGTGAIGVPTLRALLDSDHQVVGVVTQPDKPVGRNQRVQAPPIKQALGEGAIAVFQPARIKEENAITQIRELAPDVIVVAAYGQILPNGALDAPRLACINVHASLLPRWRGAAPIQAAIAAGDERTGITIMYVAQGLDTGDILLQQETKISPNETGGSLHDRLADLAPALVLNSLQLIERGDAPRQPQDSTQATYAPKLTRDCGRIDWSEPAELVERKIRAFNPWPGSFTEIETDAGPRKLKVSSAVISDQSGEPGKILRADDQLVIATARNAVSLVEVQLEGRKRMSAAEFIRGNRWISTATAVHNRPD